MAWVWNPKYTPKIIQYSDTHSSGRNTFQERDDAASRPRKDFSVSLLRRDIWLLGWKIVPSLSPYRHKNRPELDWNPQCSTRRIYRPDGVVTVCNMKNAVRLAVCRFFQVLENVEFLLQSGWKTTLKFAKDEKISHVLASYVWILKCRNVSNKSLILIATR